MAFGDDVFPPDDLCEICGGQLDDEIVIQEFADGSLARLCSECAAGAALGSEQHLGHDPIEPVPESQPLTEADPLERTKELLTPVVDLIGLQREMQAGLERLAASLETFAAGVFTENLDKKTTVESRVHSLERELEATRTRLREAEALLAAAGIALPSDLDAGGAAPATAAGEQEGAGAEVADQEAEIVGAAAAPAGPSDIEAAPAVEAAAVVGTAAAAAAAGQAAGVEPTPASEESFAEATPIPVPIEAAFPRVAEPAGAPAGSSGEVAESAGPPDSTATETPAVAGMPATSPPTPLEGTLHGFRIEEVQAAQRYFNESPFTGKTRDVQSSLGRPRANLTRAAGPEPRAFVTVAWDIVWYQYLVDMRLDVPSDQRVVLRREGMDLDELAHYFKEKNAIIDDAGRLDASELEIKLLSDPSALITEMTAEQERVLEDATEEIWDQRIAPEFKWDD